MKSFGLSVALLTPFDEGGGLDAARFGAHARNMLDRGADGITLFGTTGEGASVGAIERKRGIETVLSAGCPSSKIVLGVCATSVAEAREQVAEGVACGIVDFLLVPPFYFKGVSDDGLFAWHMELFTGVDPTARFVLYHIPQVTGVGLSVDLVGRLVSERPERVLAVKDSSGDWSHAQALIEIRSIPVLVGDERLLHRAMASGAGGAISGLANLYPERMAQIVTTATEDAALSAEVTRIVSHPVVPALKAILAARKEDKSWERVRPPLMDLGAAARAELLADEAIEA